MYHIRHTSAKALMLSSFLHTNVHLLRSMKNMSRKLVGHWNVLSLWLSTIGQSCVCLLKAIFLLHSARLAFDPLIPLSSLRRCWHQVFQLHYKQLRYSLLFSQALSERSLILSGGHKFYNQPALPLMSHTL